MYAQVRQQVQGSLHLHKYKGTLGTLRSIYNVEGPLGLFKGLGTALFNVPLFWSIYWYSYENLKIRIHQEYPDLPVPALHIIAATISGGTADVVTNPFWVVRTRIQTLILHPETKESLRHQQRPSVTPSTWQMFRLIYKEEGPRAFYKGLTASLLGLPHVAIQFPLYEYLKGALREARCSGEEGECSDSLGDFILASITAKLLASSVTYPHEVLRVRMQDNRQRHMGLYDVTRRIVREEGLRALYAGFRVNMIRLIPSTTSTFVTYEYVTKLLVQRQGHD